MTPLSQAVLLDINPPERHAQAMMTAYVNDVRPLLVSIVLCAPLVLLLRPQSGRTVRSGPCAGRLA